MERLLGPFERFAAAESSGGLVLLGCAVVALAWANSPWSENYFGLWEANLGVALGSFTFSTTLHHFINDGLMGVFLFVVGLEIKRELLVGELSTWKHAALPIFAALGGMLVPAGLYSIVNAGGQGSGGWGIPMATDIAFAIGVVALLRDRVPVSLRVFLVALAIADDIGAVLVIALFYTESVSWSSLALAGGLVLLLVLVNSAGVRRPAAYAMLGVFLWAAMLASGVHATIAGILLAATIPSRTRINEDEFLRRGRLILDDFERGCGPDETVLTSPVQQNAIHELERACEQAQAPLGAIEHKLHGVVAFAIMPLFALANAGVRIDGGILAPLGTPVALGIILGLVIGKPLGITLAAWLSTRIGAATIPADANWRALHGVSWLGGIGFTMSLFIAELAFGRGELLDDAKVGILAASAIAGIVGWTAIVLSARAIPVATTESN
ncbi:MAG: Na+/H+ antiporter NhaA [Anaerolineae bacterium]|nr:Na+/H+ antiporter NhaA [Gemmatimonadaceae bacterium]